MYMLDGMAKLNADSTIFPRPTPSHRPPTYSANVDAESVRVFKIGKKLAARRERDSEFRVIRSLWQHVMAVAVRQGRGRWGVVRVQQTPLAALPSTYSIINIDGWRTPVKSIPLNTEMLLPKLCSLSEDNEIFLKHCPCQQ